MGNNNLKTCGMNATENAPENAEENSPENLSENAPEQPSSWSYLNLTSGEIEGNSMFVDLNYLFNGPYNQPGEQQAENMREDDHTIVNVDGFDDDDHEKDDKKDVDDDQETIIVTEDDDESKDSDQDGEESEKEKNEKPEYNEDDSGKEYEIDEETNSVYDGVENSSSQAQFKLKANKRKIFGLPNFIAVPRKKFAGGNDGQFSLGSPTTSNNNNIVEEQPKPSGPKRKHEDSTELE